MAQPVQNTPVLDAAAAQHLEPATVLIPIDTEKVLEQTHFQRLSYDSLFATQSPAGPLRHDGTLHMQKHDFILPVLLLLMLAYVTWIRYVFARELNENITVVINANLGHQIYRDREFSANIFKLLTFLNFTFTAGVFLFLLVRYFQVEMPFASPVINIAIFIAAIIVLYLLKGLFYDIFTYVFKVGNMLSFFRFNALIIYHLLGIALLPLTILAAFARPPVNTWSLFAGLAVIGIALLIRAVKGLTMLRMLDRFHIVYFLLYICALEIAPILIAVKLFGMWS